MILEVNLKEAQKMGYKAEKHEIQDLEKINFNPSQP